ncbi:MAG: hypothetical protein V4611_05030 [Patescibacteria group bacterium]
MSTSKTSRVWSSIAFALSIITVGFAIWLFMNRQFALDQVTVWSYEPTASVEELKDKVQLTEKGQFIFYATKPAVANSEEFNSSCPRQEAGSPILGCYTTDGRIYVFDVTNTQLDGMKEVTAAHEMLHAVWQRLDSSEQARLTTLLQTAYENNITPKLKERMEYYQRNEPDAITNELHSIIGTEVSDVGPELEKYYAQYFENRQTILSFYAKYDTVYSTLYDRADQLFADMEALSTSIQEQSKQYDADVAQLTADINSFNTRANSGEFNTVSQFNAERATLVRRSAQLEVQRDAINGSIATYNVMYEEYQTIASQLEFLNSSIDSFKALEETPSV